MHAQKNEAIGTLAGGVAHDLNNIPAGIISYPELLIDRLPADSSLIGPFIFRNRLASFLA
jgi:two-component system, cell cycle sensor histidine kinase and response regulator CckA